MEMGTLGFATPHEEKHLSALEGFGLPFSRALR